ncbi:MAG TPA: hypothetical protein PLB83_00735 [Bacillota bacterium]|nr:hypothetical protein [Bacillota bacterium]
MENLIRELVELDKLKRLELKKLEDEKAKLGSFLREERKRIEAEYQAEAKKIYDARKNEVDKIIAEAHVTAKADFEKNIKDLDQDYKKNKDQWIKTLYQYCIE